MRPRGTRPAIWIGAIPSGRLPRAPVGRREAKPPHAHGAIRTTGRMPTMAQAKAHADKLLVDLDSSFSLDTSEHVAYGHREVNFKYESGETPSTPHPAPPNPKAPSSSRS